MNTALGERIKKRLKELHLTQSWLAGQVGLSPAQITQIIKGQRGTNIDTLIDIGAVLGISREEVIRLYRNESQQEKSSIRNIIELGLNRIERIDETRLEQVADLVDLIANSLRGSDTHEPKNTKRKAEDKRKAG